MSRKRNVKINENKNLVTVNLNSIPPRKREHTYMRDGFLVIGHEDMILQCTVCNKISNQIDFPFSNTDTYGRKKLRNQCRDCHSKNMKILHNLRKIVTIEKPNKCPICLDSEKSLELDHCHKTGKFRGWLCTTCNVASGRFKDSIEVIKRLLEYHENFIRQNNESFNEVE
jgi:Zn finger protein HypA/HybF involved in hydrogenase expression